MILIIERGSLNYDRDTLLSHHRTNVLIAENIQPSRIPG